jgi:GT2 family glycosyltransferase
VLVDNNSRDESVDRVREDYPDVRILTLSANVGFAGGCNAGIAVARGEFVATLNNDAVADPHWLAELMNATADRPDVGMVASKMLFADDRGTINSIGIALDRAGIAWDRGGGRLDGITLEKVEVFGPCAGAALYRRSMFDDIGGFDEDFFMYLEDVDLAWRAQLAGWRGILAPEARVFHEHSASAGPTSSFKRYHLARNKVWLITKNYPSPEIWLYLPVILLYDVAAVSFSIVTQDSGASA